ncbi:hypothetical protein CEXT_373831 [Caerostris extrusa]|uniref:Uncharacterized protein n=1 Tax=Caerostris extrusa TaxID=172846 RepID=A0AAV4SAU3_CAEEX|nr:hypothetical protein CEXT_373831 [Caerostris extrusa]
MGDRNYILYCEYSSIKNSSLSEFLIKTYLFIIKNYSSNTPHTQNSSSKTIHFQNLSSQTFPVQHNLRIRVIGVLRYLAHTCFDSLFIGHPIGTRRKSRPTDVPPESHLFARASAELPFQFPAKPKPHACGLGPETRSLRSPSVSSQSSAAQTTSSSPKAPQLP